MIFGGWPAVCRPMARRLEGGRWPAIGRWLADGRPIAARRLVDGRPTDGRTWAVTPPAVGR
eukprot:4356626-Lingulodinium_polyedra.AAC.1